MRLNPDDLFDDLNTHMANSYVVFNVVFSIILTILIPSIGIFLVSCNVMYFSWVYFINRSRDEYFKSNLKEALLIGRDDLIDQLEEIDEMLEIISDEENDGGGDSQES